MIKNKTVYVLGAGFSMDANAPSQDRLVRSIFELQHHDARIFDQERFARFQALLSDQLLIPLEQQIYVALEDIFTPLDRCIAELTSYRKLTFNETLQVREDINYLIATTLEIKLRHQPKIYIDQFAEYLVNKASTRSNYNYNANDPVSVISLNWDILLDDSLHEALQGWVDKHSSAKNAVVDYCCHISSYLPGDERVKPGLETLGKGGFNAKLLKLHGSLNWLQCPRCQRLYVGFGEKIALESFKQNTQCRHCDDYFGSSNAHALISNLIMPTFLKNLSNPQYKLIWQNAGIELAEAQKIVFIGYSLPAADFEMRQLLSRMVPEKAEILVVTKGKKDSPEGESFKRSYELFFGTRSIDFRWDGAEHFVTNELNTM